MTNKIWTGRAKMILYKLLPDIEVNGKKVGYYTKEWTFKAPHFTTKEWKEVESKLYDAMIDAGAFPGKKPKGPSSIGFQIHHTISPQNNPLRREGRHNNRFAAYHSGFMTMSDIVRLEEEAEKRHGVRPFKDLHESEI